MPLRLHRAAHHAVRQPWFAVFGHERGNDGLERALARRIAIRMRRLGISGLRVAALQHEHLAAILEDETQARRRHAAAHAAIVRLDQRDHHAVGIGGGEVDGVAFVEFGNDARLDAARGTFHRQQLAAFLRIGFRDQTRDRRVVERGIGVRRSAVGERDLFRFDEQMHVLGAAETVAFQIVGFEQIEDLQRGDALPVRRQFPDVVTAIVGADRVDPFAGVRGHVLIAQETIVGIEIRIDAARDLALVERIAAAVRDLLQCIREIRIAPHLAFARRASGFRRAAIDGELFLEPRPLRQHRHAAAPVIRDDVVHRMTVARVTDGGRQILRHRAFAETPMQREPAVDGTRHAHRQWTMRGNIGQAAPLEFVERQRFGRTARTVVAVQLFRLRIPHDGEQIAADAVAGRLHQSKRGVCSDRGIHRTAAIAHRLQRDLGRQRMRGGRHRMRRVDLAAGGEGFAGDAVGRFRMRGHDGQQARERGGHRQGAHGNRLGTGMHSVTRPVRRQVVDPFATRANPP